MESFATVEDLSLLWRPMTIDEEVRANEYLRIVSNELRLKADNYGQDLDEMIKNKPMLLDVAKSVTCDIVARILMTSTNTEPMSTISESANGYSMSGTFLVPGGGVFIKKSELARLGLKKQRLRTIEFDYGVKEKC